MRLLKKLCEQDGLSGMEEDVFSLIISEIKDFADLTRDGFGDLIATVKGKKRPKKVAYFAHADEVGLMIKDYDQGGFASFSCVGGINPAVLQGKAFRAGKYKGVSGLAPVHLVDDEEMFSTKLKAFDMFLDFGFKTKEEALEKLPLGSPVAFDEPFYISGNQIFAKALDDRIGCRILIDMIKSRPEYETTFVFTKCEETGTHGARAASFAVKPDVAVVLECTTSADTPDDRGGKAVTLIGGGAVISYRDGGTMYDLGLYKKALETAEKHGIKYQTKTMVAGGNDSRSIQTACEGAAVAAFSVPARNLHASVSTASKKDYEAVRDLAVYFNNEIGLR